MTQQEIQFNETCSVASCSEPVWEHVDENYCEGHLAYWHEHSNDFIHEGEDRIPSPNF